MENCITIALKSVIVDKLPILFGYMFYLSCLKVKRINKNYGKMREFQFQNIFLLLLFFDKLIISLFFENRRRIFKAQ